MSPRFVLGRENVQCVAEVVNRSLKADRTDFVEKEFAKSSISQQRQFKSSVRIRHRHKMLQVKVKSFVF